MNSKMSENNNLVESMAEFSREEVKELIHILTSEIKSRGSKEPYIYLPFRPELENNNKKLSFFIQKIFQNLNDLSLLKKIIRKTDVFTIMSTLKFIWSRLPDGCIIGWKAYLIFKNLEKEQNYPKNAFLEIMPTCLSSAEHASIVYDFVDLMIRLCAYSNENQMDGKKIAKLAGFWAFSGTPPSSSDSSSSSSVNTTTFHNFQDGLNDWLPASEAMFHLLLSFLRSMLRSDSKVKIQRSLQLLLAENPYPPPEFDVTTCRQQNKHLISMPLLTINARFPSKDAGELLAKAAKLLSSKFNDYGYDDYNNSNEDFIILRNLFMDPEETIIDKLTAASRQLMDKLCSDNEYELLNNGWLLQQMKHVLSDSNKIHSFDDSCTISKIAIDDYFIWAWMASISPETSDYKRGLFGNSLIAEFNYRSSLSSKGEVKWIVIQETIMSHSISASSSSSAGGTLFVDKSQSSSFLRQESLFSESMSSSINSFDAELKELNTRRVPPPPQKLEVSLSTASSEKRIMPVDPVLLRTSPVERARRIPPSSPEKSYENHRRKPSSPKVSSVAPQEIEVNQAEYQKYKKQSQNRSSPSHSPQKRSPENYKRHSRSISPQKPQPHPHPPYGAPIYYPPEYYYGYPPSQGYAPLQVGYPGALPRPNMAPQYRPGAQPHAAPLPQKQNQQSLPISKSTEPARAASPEPVDSETVTSARQPPPAASSVPPPQHIQRQPYYPPIPPQGYYPPPQGYYPPQPIAPPQMQRGYYPPPISGGYYPTVPPQGYYPPPQGGRHARSPTSPTGGGPQEKKTRSDMAIAAMPAAPGGFNKLHGPGSKPADKKALRSAFVSGDFGI